VGTTDTPLKLIDIEPVALENEINFILQTAEKYFIMQPKREDILSIFAGLRPLAANPDNTLATKEISRRHKIILSPSQLLTITGGKWTTYRLMAEETIDKAIREHILEKKNCVTSNLKLSTIIIDNSFSRLHVYGDQSTEIEQIIKQRPELGYQMDLRLPYSRAEIIWICRNEMPVTLEDILARRTRALFLDVRASEAIAPEVASLMAREFGFDDKWQKRQLELYKSLIKNYL
jgi:glycerol-3-phosphate dehydrogenase